MTPAAASATQPDPLVSYAGLGVLACVPWAVGWPSPTGRRTFTDASVEVLP
mgnify:CR=1 FL=1